MTRREFGVDEGTHNPERAAVQLSTKANFPARAIRGHGSFACMNLSSEGTSEILRCLYAETMNGTRDRWIGTEKEAAHLERKGTSKDEDGLEMREGLSHHDPSQAIYTVSALSHI